MTRLLELIVALILVIVLGVVVGFLLPTHGHVERTIEISHNMEHVADVLNNFRTFPDYSSLRSLDPATTYETGGATFGVGATTSWQGNDSVGSGTLEITQSKPGEIVWSIDNDWRGQNKHFTIDLGRTENQKLITIRMSYDVDYGWNLIDRYSQLYLHGAPASFIQYSENNLQSMLANIPNVDYAQLDPRLVDTPQQPILLVPTNAPRNLDLIAEATIKSLDKIQAAIKALGVQAVGTPYIITTNWGDQNYTYDVAQPISQSTLQIDGVSHDLTALPPPMTNAQQNLAYASSTPASAGSAPLPAVPGTELPGQITDDGLLVINNDVRAVMAFGGRALAADWPGDQPAGLALMRLALKAYAATHGYDFNEYVDRFYNNYLPSVTDAEAKVPAYTVYLPIQAAPAQTPAQIADAANTPAASSSAALAPAASSSVAPAPATSIAAPASPVSSS
ncbi:MAG: polyketide cyclase [Xanthomonadales bacterium]|nr:polyketide cyclase [Xanthomonadales bacterium]